MEERLFQERPLGLGEEALGGLAEGIAGDKSSSRAKLRLVLRHPGIKRRAVDAGQAHVAEDDVVGPFGKPFDRGLAAGHDVAIDAENLQHFRQDLSDLLFVVDDDDAAKQSACLRRGYATFD